MHIQPVAAPVRPQPAPAADAAWQVDDILALYDLPLPELLHRAQSVHRRHFAADTVQLSTLLSIKTGGCPEDCGYCPQSARYETGVPAQPLLPLEDVLQAARAARDSGARRFCMGAAWRSPKPHQLDAVAEMVAAVKALGLETCVTLGMLRAGQAEQLKQAGLDYYNHNLDTSPAYYGEIISTRTYQDRLDTLRRVRGAGLSVCCGGIVGMGESRRERATLIAQLADLRPYPESVPINNLVAVPGTPLADAEPLDPFELVRTVAVARVTMPTAMVRLSAGRESLNDAEQALCFLAGANSIFYGDVLLTAANPQADADRRLLARLGMRAGDALPPMEAACP
ncbi:biotin synthase BioB [Bordetella genomosp. 13]|uniref:biotin synthase BioB n=1 Tax=Bordetella genomosp. 13 TaxID=463040 RepID=UPI0011A29626|nr:biotin synthase BioB [Bordetella genomosp. 13]